MHPPLGTNKANPRRITLLASLCALVSLTLYLLAPGVIAAATSSVPSHVWQVFGWIKPCDAKALGLLREQTAFDAELLFFGLYAALFAGYAFMVRLVKGAQTNTVRNLVFGGGAVFLTVFLVSPVMLSSDVYAYGFYGRLLSLYGRDAYAVDASLVSADPFLALFGHSTPSVYGPLWTLISAGVTWVGGENIGLTVLLFRAVAAGSVLLGAGLIWSCLRRLAPERAMQGVVFFLWNPLVITEAGLSAHNDAAMIVLVLLAIWLHLKGLRACAVVALTLSALVKFVTGPLVPLYLLMTLRESGCWKDRTLLVVRSVLIAAVVTAVILPLAHVKSSAPTQSYALAPDFYANNFHELLFKGLRRLYGEDSESVNVPMNFGNWWVRTNISTELRTDSDPNAPVQMVVKKGERLLVMAMPDDWIRVYHPPSRQYGFVLIDHADTVDFPPDSEADPLADQLENGPLEWPTVTRANFEIRVVTCLLFAGFGLFAAWRTSSFERFLVWAPTVMLAMYFTVMTQIWPWYLIWALALGALKPGNSPIRLAAVLSAGVMTLYCTISYDQGDYPWVYYYRSLPAVVIPSVGFVLYEVIKRRRERRKLATLSLSPASREIAETPEMSAS